MTNIEDIKNRVSEIFYQQTDVFDLPEEIWERVISKGIGAQLHRLGKPHGLGLLVTYEYQRNEGSGEKKRRLYHTPAQRRLLLAGFCMLCCLFVLGADPLRPPWKKLAKEWNARLNPEAPEHLRNMTARRLRRCRDFLRGNLAIYVSITNSITVNYRESRSPEPFPPFPAS